MSRQFADLIRNRARKAKPDGRLRYGCAILLLGCTLSAMVAFGLWAIFNDEDVKNNSGELITLITAIIGSTMAGLYTFAEYFLTKGTYDESGIKFFAPLTGRKTQQWIDLVSIKYDNTAQWYVLKFRDGKIIRISEYLYGHGGLLNIIKNLDHEFEHFDDDESDD